MSGENDDAPEWSALEEALYSLDELDGDEVGDVGDWLDALASTLAETRIGQQVDAESLYDFAKRGRTVHALRPLYDVRKSIRRLEKYADSFEYGTCTWTTEKISKAEDARIEVQGAIEAILDGLRS